jgi:hypothetical protein
MTCNSTCDFVPALTRQRKRLTYPGASKPTQALNRRSIAGLNARDRKREDRERNREREKREKREKERRGGETERDS